MWADGAVVGDLDTGGVLLQRRAGRSHEWGRRTSSCRRRRPFMWPSTIGGSRRSGASCCRRPCPPRGRSRRWCAPRSVPCPAVAARIVETLTRRLDLARRKGLRDQAGVVGRADDLDPVRLQVLGPVLDVIAHRLVAQSSVVQHLVRRPSVSSLHWLQSCHFTRWTSVHGPVHANGFPRRSPPAGRHHRRGQTLYCRHRRAWGIALCHLNCRYAAGLAPRPGAR